jgi:CRP-like cAMP-binding protein
VGARQPLPPRWFGAYGLALVRRGVIIRQRVDADGSAIAVDAIGPGGATPLFEGGELGSSGYAVDDALLCLCPSRHLREAVDAGAPTSTQLVALHAAALDRVERIAQARSRSTAIARVAALLCVLADTLSPPHRLTCLPASLQQRDLAALLAMRHESVCRAMRTLARMGAAARTSAGIRVLHRARLEHV